MIEEAGQRIEIGLLLDAVVQVGRLDRLRQVGRDQLQYLPVGQAEGPHVAVPRVDHSHAARLLFSRSVPGATARNNYPNG